MNSFADTEPMTQVRLEDSHALVKVTREIPLPWLLAAVAAFIVNTTQSWQSNQNTEKALEVTNKTLEKLGDRVERTNALVVSDGGIRAQKDAEHDAAITDLKSRVTSLEALYPRAMQKPQR